MSTKNIKKPREYCRGGIEFMTSLGASKHEPHQQATNPGVTSNAKKSRRNFEAKNSDQTEFAAHPGTRMCALTLAQ
jgi:hypothetical protein